MLAFDNLMTDLSPNGVIKPFGNREFKGSVGFRVVFQVLGLYHPVILCPRPLKRRSAIPRVLDPCSSPCRLGLTHGKPA